MLFAYHLSRWCTERRTKHPYLELDIHRVIQGSELQFLVIYQMSDFGRDNRFIALHHRDPLGM